MLSLTKKSLTKGATVPMEASKSECNRALVINALAEKPAKLNNISNARDSQTMIRLLREDQEIWDVLDAGTTMRFLTAYAAITNRKKIMTGTARMQERPIGILVDALRSLGADIEYLKNDGFPPFKIKSFDQQKADTLEMRGDTSSQYISAILMTAPLLPKGLKLNLTGDVNSRPYIEMTIDLMRQFGVEVKEINERSFEISPQSYTASAFSVESDWSGASYWFSAVALQKDSELFLRGLKEHSTQGDKAIIELMNPLGVSARFEEGGLRIWNHGEVTKNPVVFDFNKCPDLAQTVAVTCAALNVTAHFKGVQSLRIKETDRTLALQEQLAKFGVTVSPINDPFEFMITPNADGFPTKIKPVINTYEDHRMAMAFAPLCLLMELEIEEEEVVKKSYPDFWQDLEKVTV
ncbi:3-phosphoshikimate 1-carboxyvinyltransferase [Persicobacter psychrovividus]|uniref:3-phosphoshikimate 1-carboxyvinyltransferase n=1 Tax=Persicobacter psychrovividus TaxID=387638 RepID=A0ABN6L939_9BACT|nr:3-phosphoshikimate 1-carboxyvinyltransferase [Persicobacter psychrovividus]